MGVQRADRWQREHRVAGFPLAVIYKYVDDQGNYLAATLTYYAFLAIFPALLLASSILGFILQGNPELQDRLLESALSQFPIIGDELGRPGGLRGSAGAVIVGSVAALYGCLGLATATQNLMAVGWGVPRNSRPNPFLLRGKSIVLTMLAGFSVLLVSLFSTLVSNTELLGLRVEDSLTWLLRGANVLVVAMVLTGLFRLAAAQGHHIAHAAPGGFFVALLWQALQQAGAWYATNVLSGTSAMNQTFGLVLGLIGLIYVAAMIGVLGVELNVVLALRLWPRALLTPFTDRVDLTEADRRAYAMYAQTQRHKGFETVTVRFDSRTGETHEIVLDKGARDTREQRHSGGNGDGNGDRGAE